MSQCDQLAVLLSDGRWWSTRELLLEVPCIVHSRVAELRKRGLEIEHETVGAGAAGSRYRLVQIGAEPEADRDAGLTNHGFHPQARTANGAPAASLDASQASSALNPARVPPESLMPGPGQLTIEDVAA